MARHGRAVDLAVPYWDLCTNTTLANLRVGYATPCDGPPLHLGIMIRSHQLAPHCNMVKYD